MHVQIDQQHRRLQPGRQAFGLLLRPRQAFHDDQVRRQAHDLLVGQPVAGVGHDLALAERRGQEAPGRFVQPVVVGQLVGRHGTDHGNAVAHRVDPPDLVRNPYLAAGHVGDQAVGLEGAGEQQNGQQAEGVRDALTDIHQN